jgi:SpoU rRNA methylase family enzyme
MKIPKIVKIRCECGDELLLVPDLKEMGKAIEDHVELHLQSLKAPSCTPAEAERLKDKLIAQALTKAGQSEDEENQ